LTFERDKNMFEEKPKMSILDRIKSNSIQFMETKVKFRAGI